MGSAHLRNIQAQIIFIRMYLSQTDDNYPEAGSQMLCRKSFAVSFMHLELRREQKEGYMKVKENKIGMGLQGS